MTVALLSEEETARFNSGERLQDSCWVRPLRKLPSFAVVGDHAALDEAVVDPDLRDGRGDGDVRDGSLHVPLGRRISRSVTVDDPLHAAGEHDAPNLPIGSGVPPVRAFRGKPVGGPRRAGRGLAQGVEFSIGRAAPQTDHVDLPVVFRKERVAARAGLRPAGIVLEVPP